MMTDLGKLRVLEARLAAATGPDRELDGEIAGVISPNMVLAANGWLSVATGTFVASREFTSSLDAAIAFCEAMGGEAKDIFQINDVNGGLYNAEVYLGRYGLFDASAIPSRALAICLATVRALIAQAEAQAEKVA